MNTAQNLKQALKKSAKTFSEEPLEILKNMARQVAPEVARGPGDTPYQQDNKINEDQERVKKQLAESDGRKIEALENELKDIRRQKLFNDLMQRIQSGEDVSIDSFQELKFEERDVLKAQLFAAKNRQAQASGKSFVEPSAKKGRRMGFGQKQSAQKQTTRVEKPVPPSG